ncbi:MAG: formylglycine-generating enzyme family protein [Deltaproteobacteria bacterium]|nr:formylglycine-generating enzyme family protein [Deltaproteobacteria bacterium]
MIHIRVALLVFFLWIVVPGRLSAGCAEELEDVAVRVAATRVLGTVSDGVKEAIINAHCESVVSPTRLAAEVLTNLHSSNAWARSFARQMLKNKSEDYSILRAISKVEDIAAQGMKSYKESEHSWLSNPKEDWKLKAEYLRAHVVSKDFDRLFDYLPKEVQQDVKRQLGNTTSALVFRDLARTRMSADAFADLTVESFEFVAFKFPEPKRAFLGSPPGESGRWPNEERHAIQFTKDFAMGVTQVTQAQWVLVMDKPNPSHFKDGPAAIEIRLSDGTKTKVLPNHPVENVSWHDITEYLEKLNRLDQGREYRRPSEAEWEYAARGGKRTRFSFGDNEQELVGYAWFSNNSDNRSHPVAVLKPNAFGLYDMHGNVSEWTEDIYVESPSSASQQANTSSLNTSGLDQRVVRGANFLDNAELGRAAHRYHFGPRNSFNLVGFRVARTP